MPTELREFDYSVRVHLASNALCGQRTPSVVLKLQLSESAGTESSVVLEVDADTLQQMLAEFAAIHSTLRQS